MRDLVIADIEARSKAAVDPHSAYGGHRPALALLESPEKWLHELEVRLLELHREEEKLAEKVDFWADKGIDPDKDWPVYRQLVEVRHAITWTALRKSEVERRVGISSSDHSNVIFLKEVIEEHRRQKESFKKGVDAADLALWSALDGEFNF
jgi:hypothetical protein